MDFRSVVNILNMKLFFVIFVAFVTISSAKPTDTVKYLTLIPLGKYSGISSEGINYDKNYYVSSYLKMDAPNARSYCKSFGSNIDLGSFESRDEFLVLRSKLEPIFRDKNMFVIVGGFAREASNNVFEYRWISSGVKVFSDNLQPPDTNQTCLGIKKEKNYPLTLVPISCKLELNFVCEEVALKYEN